MGFSGSFTVPAKAKALDFPKLMLNKDRETVAYWHNAKQFTVVASSHPIKTLGSIVTLIAYDNCYEAGWTDFHGEVTLKND